jgi:3-oxoacyl-[acyl-carrier protein] reductase
MTMEERPVVLVTGTRKGIGRHLAEHFAAKGFLVEGCSRDVPDWELEHYYHHRVDVTDEAQVRQMITSIQKRHGRLDITINNAGIASMNLALLTPSETVDRILGTNFVGTFLVSRESAKLMRRRKYGRIVNFTTIAVPMALKGESIYAASKSAVETYTRILARELAPFGITCNTVGPGPVETDLLRGVPDDKIADILDGLAIKRMCRLEDVSNVVDFFVSPESSYVTGQLIYLGGIG